MFLKTVHVRFYKSFNYDFLRKNHEDAQPLPWEHIDGKWYPFVRIPLLRDVTTIVGANESGKSHLLTAIEKGLSGQNLTRRDFCRYSQFFTVEEGQMRWPDFGFEFTDLSSEERDAIRAATGISPTSSIDRFLVFRTDRTTLQVWLPDGDSYKSYSVKPSALDALLPKVFHISSDVGLPDTVPLTWLIEASRPRWHRKDRHSILDAFASHLTHFKTEDSLRSSAKEIIASFGTFVSNGTHSATPTTESDHASREYRLAKDLIFKVARIDTKAVAELHSALMDGDEGLANGILQQMNERLANVLNFPKWWVQDRDFQLVMSARDEDLVFTIRDRTHTEYCFGERSAGLKYFLSYYIQYLAHEPPADRHEILLMDEPDAFLSSQGQQDLLKIFNSFATPEGNQRPIQVVYVTHSPFLIDKNHGDRIRVLEKGVDDEGTRVVNDASKNHYEPLRSSFGAFVGETTFIGHCNLMVEGIADQVLIAGAANFLRSRATPWTETLDLNRITVVPSGSASHIPYLVYLARGRDVEQPAVIVLLDSDQAGNDARKGLKKRGPIGPRILHDDYVLQIADLASDAQSLDLPDGRVPRELEDLIPPCLAVEAGRAYLHKLCGLPPDTASQLSADKLLANWKGDCGLFDALNAAAQEIGGADTHIDKVGFARYLFDVILAAGPVSSGSPLSASIAALETNMRILLARLAAMQRSAERETSKDRISRRIDRAIRSFLRDHPTSARREDAQVLLEEVETVLDDSLEADQVRNALNVLRREHDLGDTSTSHVLNFDQFYRSLQKLKYAAKIATQDTPASSYHNLPQSQSRDEPLDTSTTSSIPTTEPNPSSGPKAAPPNTNATSPT